MPVDKHEVRRIAALAKLALQPEEIERFEGDLNDILEHVGRVQSADVEDASAEVDPNGNWNVFREDELRPGLDQKEALQNAPDSDGTCFRVPPVLPTTEH